jgi:hypothetical protein
LPARAPVAPSPSSSLVPPIGAARSLARALPLAHGPHLLVLSSPTVRAHNHVHAVYSTPTTHAKVAPAKHWPFLATHTPLPLPPSSFAHSKSSSTHLAPRAHQRRVATVRHGLVLVLPSPLSPRRVCCLGDFCFDVRDPGHPSVRPSPRFLSARAHRTSIHTAAASPSSTRVTTVPLPSFKGPRDSPRGNQPPPPLISLFPNLGYAQLLTGVRQRHRRAMSPQTATLRCLCAGAVPTSVFAAPSSTSLSPSIALERPACPHPRLRWRSTMSTGGAAAGGQGEPTRVSRLISDAYLRSNDPVLNKRNLILTARWGSDHSNSSLTGAPAARPDLSTSLTPGHYPVWPTCQPRTLACAHVLARRSNLGL